MTEMKSVSSDLKTIEKNALIILAAGIAAGFVFSGFWMASSILIGGLLALVNFRLMKAGIDRMIYPGGKKRDGLLIFGFIGRLLLILLCLFAMIQTAKFNLIGAVAGLAIIVVAGMCEAVRHLLKR